MRDLVRTTNSLGYLDALKRRHREVDARVEAEQRNLCPDPGVLQRLKRERLKLRDELVRYETLLHGRATIAA